MKLNQRQKLKILKKIAGTFHFLHENNLVHRDLKMENILLTKKLKPRLIDFGISKQGGQQFPTETLSTFQYMAPESLYDSLYLKQSDVYSFAILFWELIADSKAYKLGGGQDEFSMINKIVKQSHRPDLELIPKEFQNFVGLCWN